MALRPVKRLANRKGFLGIGRGPEARKAALERKCSKACGIAECITSSNASLHDRLEAAKLFEALEINGVNCGKYGRALHELVRSSFIKPGSNPIGLDPSSLATLTAFSEKKATEAREVIGKTTTAEKDAFRQTVAANIEKISRKVRL